MAHYVDGYVIPIPKRNLSEYRRLARKAGRVWKEFGALEFHECAGDDLNVKGVVSFRKLLKLKGGETALFSWITYRSKSDRKRINARVMKDPRITGMMDPKHSPFNPKRMVYGGFRTIIDL